MRLSSSPRGLGDAIFTAAEEIEAAGGEALPLAGNSAYTLSKMGMTMLTLGLAADEADAGIAANCLWPRTIIGTAAVQNLLGGDAAMARSRTPAIVADAAYEIVKTPPGELTG